MIPYTTRVRQDFTEAAETYDNHATLQRQVSADLANLARHYLLSAECWLDVGCGTGALARWLSQEATALSALVQLDVAEGMCRRAVSHAPTVCADALHLPFASSTFDGVFSSLTLQWATPLEATIHELRRVLRPAGVLAFSTLLPGTLAELAEAFEQAGLASPLHSFYPASIWEAALIAHGFRLESHQTQTISVPFTGPEAVLAHLKGIGATRKRETRALTRSQLHACLRAYPRTKEGNVTATYQLWLGLAHAI